MNRVHRVHRVLLVGGQAEFIERKVVPRLQSLVAPDGAPVRVPRHVAWKTDRFPTDYVRVDAIMVVTDMVSHTLSNAARDHARRLHLPYVPITRKWLESAVSLIRYGYRNAPPVPEASAPPVAAPVEAAPEVHMPPKSKSKEPRAASLLKALQTLAADPAATNAMLMAAHGDHIRPVLVEARRTLGIDAPRYGGTRTVTVNHATFLAACAKYGIEATDTLFRFPDAAAVAPSPAVEVPVAAPVERPAPPSPLDTLREAVALLRAAMADADVISLSIDREGNVRAERMTITTVRM